MPTLANHPSVFDFEQGRAITLASADLPLLQAFFEANPAYFHFAHGQAVQADEAQKEYDDWPPAEMPFADRFFLGLLDSENRLIGMTSGLIDFIASGVGHLGLFIVASHLHGSGVAQAAYQALENWLRNQGMHSLRLGVIQGNVRAQHFWRRNGFQWARERGPVMLGINHHMLDVMVKPLGEISLPAYLKLVQRDQPGAS